MLAPSTPVLVLHEGTERSSGKSAQENNIEAAVALADALRPTLGPRGLDKMLVDRLGDATITNDGATILEKMDVQHPAAKMVAEVALAQDRVAGDGTKSAVILAGALLKQAHELIESGVHPSSITAGFGAACDHAVKALAAMARPAGPADRALLLAAARTSMNSKLAAAHGAALAPLCVQAASEVAQVRPEGPFVDLDDIAVVKATGHGVEDSQLVEGVVLDKERAHPEMGQRVERPAIAITNAALAVKKTEVQAAIKIVDPEQVALFLGEEERYLGRLVEDVRSSGANVLVCAKEVDPVALEQLARAGIVALAKVPQADLERLAKASGGRVITQWDDLEPSVLGHAERLEWRREAGKHLAYLTGCKGAKAVTLVVHGGTAHVVDEIERSCRDALSVVKGLIEEGTLLPGGGASAVALALGLRRFSAAQGGREQLAVEAFADALEALPRALAVNAGQDPIDALIALRTAHARGAAGMGVDPHEPGPHNMWAEGVVEPVRVVRQALRSATEAAVMILRIDDVIAAKRGGAPGAAAHRGPPVED